MCIEYTFELIQREPRGGQRLQNSSAIGPKDYLVPVLTLASMTTIVPRPIDSGSFHFIKLYSEQIPSVSAP